MRPSPRRMDRILRKNARVLLPGLVLALLLLVWEASVRLLGVPALILPGVGDVYRVSLEEFPTLLAGARNTVLEVLLAAAAATLLGFLTGTVIFFSPLIRRAIFPYLLITQTVPKVALAPVLLLWFGIGPPSRFMLAFLIAYFPMVINTVTGLATASDAMLRYARSLAASEWQVFVKVRLPHALPAVVGGAKITVSVSVIGVIVGEFVASEQGLGSLILNSAAVLNTALTIAAILWVGVIGLGLVGVVELLERRFVFWSEKE